MKYGLALILFCCTVSCGESLFDLTQKLKIEMYGVSQEPSTPTGDDTPKTQTYVLSGVSLTSETGSETTVLYSGEDPKESQIANRPQLIYFQDITDYKGTTFSGLTVSFSAEVTGVSKNASDHIFYLTDTDKIYSTAFTVETGKDIVVYVKVKWLNTVSGTTMSEPDFDISIESS